MMANAQEIPIYRAAGEGDGPLYSFEPASEGRRDYAPEPFATIAAPEGSRLERHRAGGMMIFLPGEGAGRPAYEALELARGACRGMSIVREG